MDFKEIQEGKVLWTMIGNYPYEVVVLELRPCNIPEPRGTFQNDRIVIWRKDKGSTHNRYPWELFKTKKDIKNHLFPID